VRAENCVNEQALVTKSQDELLKQMQLYKSLSDEAAACKQIHARLSILTTAAIGRKELAEFTLNAFEVDLLGAQQNLRAQTAGLVQVRHAMNLATAQRQAEARQRRQRLRQHELQIAAASLVQEAKKKFLQGRDKRQQRDRDRRIARAESQLNRLASATGLRNPCGEVHELMLKYEQRGETSRDLKATSTKLLAALVSKREELSAFETELQELGHSPAGVLTWRVVDDTARELDSARHKNQFKAELLLGEIMQCHELMSLFDLRYERMERVVQYGQQDGAGRPPEPSPKDMARWRRSLWGEEEHPWVPTPERVANEETLQSFERLALLALTMHHTLTQSDLVATS
jgi:hypothetical protein